MDDSLPRHLAFDPVPSATGRADGWTPERQRAFILALSMIGTVSIAARAAGMSRKSAYALLKRAGPGSGFARAWEEARAEGEEKVDLTVIRRAVDGDEIPYFFRGVQCGTRRVYNDRLLIAAYRAAQLRKARDRGGDREGDARK